MSSPRDQINLSCPDSGARIFVVPDTSSIQELEQRLDHLLIQPSKSGDSSETSDAQKHESLPGQPSEKDSSKPIPMRMWTKQPNEPTSTFDLMSLAGELRNKVYTNALASGTISILLLSKKTYAEAKPILYKVAVLKLGRDQPYFGEVPKDAPTFIKGLSPVPCDQDLPFIQNINIDIERGLHERLCLNNARLFDKSWNSNPDFFHLWVPNDKPPLVEPRSRGVMAPFMNTVSVAPRGTCEMILRNFDKVPSGLYQMHPVLNALKYLDNFMKVIVVITAHPDHGNRDYGDRVTWFEQAQISCINVLEESLGQATWHAEVETIDEINQSNGYLVFHPRTLGTMVERESVTEESLERLSWFS